ncbi:hypothetical protein KOW79_006749 [Hemibagrus wyckioides]|uniref:C-type lectin domain-containing protein n=1 Tax=Hemibagrus wyckioides TaxID=337641 RepID=A0A9D3P104_9TELE|nr:hypothetical protein KOW79_006749 [Hemibagrus wyckioides]
MARQTEAVLLLILATAAFASATFHLRCPYGWKKYGYRCFQYQATRLNWNSAEHHCQSLGGHLVSIHNEIEYQWVKAVIRAHDHKEKPAWIGLSDCQQKYRWVWSDGNPVTFTRWNPGEPNHWFGECCVHMSFGRKKNWNDIHCHKKYPFVCARGLW